MDGDIIKKRRLELGLTQYQIATAVGVNEATVSRWESGNIVNMRANHIAALSNVLKMELSTVMGISETLDDIHLNTIKIPVLGSVPAGTPVEAVQDIIDYEEIPAEWKCKGDFFGLIIRGDSMEPDIQNGDTVIIKQQPDAKSGEVIVAMINGYEATCKRLKKFEDGLMLIPNNKNYEPMYYTKKKVKKLPVTIIGKVVELRRKFW